MNKNDIKAFIDNVLINKDNTCTYFKIFASDKANNYGIVAAYMDYDNSNDYKPYVKIAYMPHNSIMSEYDIDWIMPYDEESGIVDDTEIELSDDDNTINWLYEQVERIKRKYII